MKKILLITAALLLTAIYAESKDLTGDWREVKRVNAKTGTSISYKDTMFLRFESSNEYVSQKKNGFIYRGTFKVEDNTLDMGARVYTILKHTKSTLKLQDEAGIYEFELYTPTSEMNTLPKEAAAQPVGSLTQMKGHWSKFKSTASKTMSEIDYTRMIKFLDIFDTYKQDNYGYIFATRDADNSPSWKIDRYDAGKQILYCTPMPGSANGKGNRELRVVKCQDNELVLEEGGITIFFRKFKQ